MDRPSKIFKGYKLVSREELEKWYRYKAQQVGEFEIENLNLKDKLHRRNMQIKILKEGLEKVRSYARYCIKCKKISFDADTFGTWTKEGWQHYNCK